jgi:hypothetical protein
MVFLWGFRPIGVVVGTDNEIRLGNESMMTGKTYLYDGYTALELLE